MVNSFNVLGTNNCLLVTGYDWVRKRVRGIFRFNFSGFTCYSVTSSILSFLDSWQGFKVVGTWCWEKRCGLYSHWRMSESAWHCRWSWTMKKLAFIRGSNVPLGMWAWFANGVALNSFTRALSLSGRKKKSLVFCFLFFILFGESERKKVKEISFHHLFLYGK